MASELPVLYNCKESSWFFFVCLRIFLRSDTLTPKKGSFAPCFPRVLFVFSSPYFSSSFRISSTFSLFFPNITGFKDTHFLDYGKKVEYVYDSNSIQSIIKNSFRRSDIVKRVILKLQKTPLQD